MKIRILAQRKTVSPSRDRSGMTLVEVVIALAITGLTVGGIVSGYIYCSTAAVKSGLDQAANARAIQRLEETRSAVWAPDRSTPVDQLNASNFPDLLVSLDLPGSSSTGTTGIIQTTIFPISTNPPMRKIHVDCIWKFKRVSLVTNSVETIRASDQ